MSRLYCTARLALAAALGAALIGPGPVARAADQPIDASLLVLRTTPSGREILELHARDAAIPFPVRGGPDDPALPGAPGALLELFAGDGQRAALALPGGPGLPGWKAKPGRRKAPAYRYLNPAAPAGPSAVKLLLLQAGVGLRVTGRAAGLALTGALGRVGVRLTVGSLRACALFDEASVLRERRGRFSARGARAAALADCSDASLAGDGARRETTTTTTSTSSSTTTTTLAAMVFGNADEFADASQHSPGFLLGSAVDIPVPVTVTHLAVIAKAAGASVRLGLYEANGGVPTTLVIGTPPTPLAPGAVEIPVPPTPISPGTYFLLAMYDAPASVGIDTSDPSAVAMYTFQDWSAGLAASIPFATQLLGQRYNYYLRAL